MAASRLSENGRLARFEFFWPSLSPFKYPGTRGSCYQSCVRETRRSTLLTRLRTPLALVSSASILIGVTLVKKVVSFFSGRSQVRSAILRR